MKKNSLFLSFFLLSFLSLYATIPAGYYNSAIGKKQAELKTALHLIIKTANVPSYGSGAGSTWAAFTKTDVRPEDGTVWDMYSNNHVAFNGNSAASGMNIEHSFAKSWWGDGRQAAQDVQHLCPSNSSANSSKGSWPMAVVDGTVTFTNGVIKVGKSNSRPGGIIDAWEPADEYKGDFARMYMYMVTAYEDYATLWTGNSVNQLDNNTYPVFEQWTVDLLLKWSRQDPVSQKEITRTNEAYNIQGNRNPYIDYPLMSEYVWGNLITTPFTTDGNVTYPYLSTPANGTTVDLGKIFSQMGSGSGLLVKAANLTGDLTVTLSGTNAAFFSVYPATITKAQAEAGYIIALNYVFQAVGTHTAVVTISGGGIVSTTINLKGVSSDEFQALPASAIEPNGFTSNWTTSAAATGYSLNVYSLQSSGTTQAKTLLEEDFLSGLPTGWTSTGYSDNTLASNMRLASGSNPGKITFPPLNLSTSGTVLTVRAKQYNSDTGAQLTATIDNQPLAVWTTGATNQDFTVNIPQSTATSVIALSAATSIRVYVDYVKVQTQGSVQTPVSVTGYPKSVGNVLNYQVIGLLADSTYYYTITPEGNGVAVSNPIQVRTKIVAGVEQQLNYKLSWSITSEGIVLNNLPENSKITLMDSIGRRLQTINSTAAEMKLSVAHHGIYLIQVSSNQGIFTDKVYY